jgi:hypothetical protein
MEVEGRVISPLEIAGYRTRPDRLAFEVSKKKADMIWPRFAAHLAKVMAREFPGIAPVEEVKVFNPKSEVKKGIVWRRALWYKGCVE